MTRQAHHYRVGDATISCVREVLLANFTPATLFPDAPASELAEAVARVPPGSMDTSGEHALLSVHTWVVRDRGRTILVDTGAGNGKSRPFTPYFDHLETSFLADLAALGVKPEEVDYVLVTHLHVDHVGWNTRLDPASGRWVPTFPRARHVMSRVEYELYLDPAHQTGRHKTSHLVQKDSVTPIVEAGLADLIEIDGREHPAGFFFEPTPGHSAAHACIRFRSAGEEALFTGDLMHHPLQVLRPEWCSILDASEEAAPARRRVLEEAAERDLLLLTAHFPATSAGRVGRDGDGFAWAFA